MTDLERENSSLRLQLASLGGSRPGSRFSAAVAQSDPGHGQDPSHDKRDEQDSDRQSRDLESSKKRHAHSEPPLS
jgi:hypothetical protein